MKKLFAVVIGLALVAGTVRAEQYNTTTKTVTNTVAAVTTQDVNAAAFTIAKNGEVAVTVSCKLTAAGTPANLFTFATGVDGTTYTGPQTVVSLTQAGTTTASVTSNINVGACGYIRLLSIGNGDNDGVVTNVTVGYTVKPNRQDGK
jgi:hypothetical protein